MKAFRVRGLVSGPLFRLLAASSVLFVCFYLIQTLHAKLVVSGVLVAAGCMAYAATFWMTATDGEERVLIRGFLPLFLVKRAFSS